MLKAKKITAHHMQHDIAPYLYQAVYNEQRKDSEDLGDLEEG